MGINPLVGLERVRVLVRAVYNGPGHKSIGWRESGEIIMVPAGPYTDILVQRGFVTREVDIPVIPLPGEPEATPQARKIAADLGIDLRKVVGTGADGRIVKGDVEAARAHAESVQAQSDEE